MRLTAAPYSITRGRFGWTGHLNLGVLPEMEPNNSCDGCDREQDHQKC